MKILVIDDEPRNIASALFTLGTEHDLKTINDTKRARSVLCDKEQTFDLVMTDLFMPLGDFQGSFVGNLDYHTPVPAGLIFALIAVNRGFPVAICTDNNHHEDILCSMLDAIEYLGTQQVIYVEARCALLKATYNDSTCGITLTEDYDFSSPIIKDWANVLTRMLCALERRST